MKNKMLLTRIPTEGFMNINQFSVLMSLPGILIRVVDYEMRI